MKEKRGKNHVAFIMAKVRVYRGVWRRYRMMGVKQNILLNAVVMVGVVQI